MNLHERTEAIADLHAAGGLNDAERRETDAHAAACAPCASLLRDASEFHRWISGTLAPDAPPADLDERILARFRAVAAPKRRPRLRSLFQAVGGIAAAAALIILGTAFTEGSTGSAENLVAALSSAAKSYETDFSIDSSGVEASKKDDLISFWWENGRTIGKTVTASLKSDEGNHWGLQRSPATFFRSNGEPRSLDRKARTLTRDNLSLEDLSVEARSADLAGKAGKGKPDSPDDSAGAILALEQGERQTVNHEVAEAVLGDLMGALTVVKDGAEPASAASLAAATTAPLQENRKIIRNADLDLEVEAYDAAFTRINALALEEKGFVAGANTQRLANGKIRATVTVRVPPERFEALLARFRELGTVRQQNIGSQDVTKAYMDLEIRRDTKQALLERLKKLLAEAKGSVKELLEVEVQMGKTIEEIESMKGELKFYDNQVGHSTVVLTVSEKDLGRPFEYVQTLQSNIGLTVRDPDDAYAKAQKEVSEAGGQVADSRMTRENDGSATGIIKARVDAEKFPALREALKKLGHVSNDTVNQQKTARGGAQGAPKPDAPLKKEQAVIDLTITTPPIVITRQAKILIETADVQEAYSLARKAIETAGGKIVNGSLSGQGKRSAADLEAHLDADRFVALVDQLKTLGLVKNAAVKHDLPGSGPTGSLPLLRERAMIGLAIVSPPDLIGEEHGIVRTIRDTFSGSWKGLLWSIEKLFVGLSLAGPWIALLLAAWLVWRRVRRKQAIGIRQ